MNAVRLLIAGLALFGAPASARAAEAGLTDDGAAAAYAGDAAASRLTVSLERELGDLVTVVFHDDGTTVTAGRGCLPVSSHEARCEPGRAAATVDLGAGDDSVRFGPSPERWKELSVFGSGGDDVIDAGGVTRFDSSVYAQFSGNGGDDTLIGSPTDDWLSGGLGDDALRGGNGDDQLHPGAGRDRLAAGGGRDDLFGNAADAAIFGGAGGDHIGVAGRGDVDVRCGEGFDDVDDAGSRPGVITETDCERGPAGQRLSPAVLSRRAVGFDLRCRRATRCQGTLELRRHGRLIATRAFDAAAVTRVRLPLPAALTHRMRRRAVTLTVAVHGALEDVDPPVDDCWWRIRIRPRG